MLIANARVARSADVSTTCNIEIRGGRAFFTRRNSSHDSLDLSGHLLLPGLINAHDHLEFNLFPRLGRRIYANASEWAADIHRPRESPLREHLSIPKRDRLVWGGLRNLLSGVTTVAHHNPYDNAVFNENFPVRVLRKFGWAHSIAFAPDLAARHRETPPDQPFILHAAEGTDRCAAAEIARLERVGILDRRTVIVHGVALDDGALETIRARGASIVWCPSSNLLTYGATLCYERIAAAAPVALGTDSAISSRGDMLDELRITAAQPGVTPRSLYSMVTDQAAQILRLEDCGRPADFVASIDRGKSPAESLLDLIPELVIVSGRIKLVSLQLAHRVDPQRLADFQLLHLEDRGEFLVPFDIARLIGSARAAVGSDVRLAGKRVSQ